MAKLTGAKLEAKLEAEISNLPAGEVRSFGDGLTLKRAGARGGRPWELRYMVRGTPHWMGLGAWPRVDLAAARQKAAEAHALIAAGKDPIEERRHQQAAQTLAEARSITFDQAAAAYIAEHEGSWRNPKHRAQWRSSLKTYAAPIIGSVAVGEITTEHVLRVLRPIWTTKRETATRVRGRIETVLAAAIVQGWAREPNVARWHNHIQMALPRKRPVVKPHAALDWQELPPFMVRLREQDSFGAMALEFAVLTAARSGEVRGATWGEIDLDGATWTIPGARMKAARPHEVPLSPRAVAVLRKAAELRGGGQFVFQGMRPTVPLSDMSILAVLKRAGRPDVTTHGFRATFKTWASDTTDHPREVIEAALAHVVGDRAERAYQRGSWLERRRKLMNEWADYCERPPADVADIDAARVRRVVAPASA